MILLQSPGRFPLWVMGGILVASGVAGCSDRRPGDHRAVGDIRRAAIQPEFIVIAHRGDSETAPENTLSAIALAFDHGADMVEVDVHLSRDGVPVIIHDDTLEETTNGRGRVADQTLAVLKTLDAGSWKAPTYAGERVPTLREALQLTRGRGRLLIDPKQDEMGKAIADVFREVGVAFTDAVLGTWNAGQVDDFVRNLPGATILLSDNEGTPETWDPSYFDHARARGVRGFEAGNKWSPEFVAEARKRGMPVIAYTVNDEPTMRHLIEVGVAGIETDALATLLRVATDLRSGHLGSAVDSRP